MKKKTSIAMIICYIGKLPWYFDYFVHSCKYNLDVHFFIITDDQSYSKKVSENIYFIYKTLDEINEIATSKLGFKTNIMSGYKLCDFKPAYGLLFSELIEEYDFWGHGDLDIIFGDIRKFMTEDILGSHDLIAVRDDYLTGYFLLFRNNSQMRLLFTNSKDYKKIFSDQKHYCFDETNFSFIDFANELHYSEIKSEVESMTHVVKRQHEKKLINAYFDFHVIEGAYGKLSWEKGVLMYNNKYEAMLYHLILLKTIYKPKRKIKTIPESFKISKTRIY
ncbi:hypothetical protein KHA90_24275 [Flavobacterium psychroterrae]|uniref:Glycosyl transferase n=1 Tax=Flavobacterium psychroterrae TaxID=2133767 RepID=A0ABS5PII6_9FLAO|nr:DUF6625 family protein [Flavobacterium psychroterrae]MBS7234123.1 hypothetical protein [Flavobacterium psychroterrae]